VAWGFVYSFCLEEGGEDIDKVSRMFASLCQSIDNHFKAEGESRLFEQITEHAPRLADRVEAMPEGVEGEAHGT